MRYLEKNHSTINSKKKTTNPHDWAAAAHLLDVSGIRCRCYTACSFVAATGDRCMDWLLSHTCVLLHLAHGRKLQNDKLAALDGCCLPRIS